MRLWVDKHNMRRPKDINWPRWREAGQLELERLVVQVRELVSDPAPLVRGQGHGPTSKGAA